MNSVIELPIDHLNELPVVAKFVIDFARGEKVFLVYGTMGAGKTTFIKELCKALGSSDSFSSPTYAIVNEYQSPAAKIYHLDLYRVQTTTELLDLGIEEYLRSGNYCFIEWPERAEEFVDKTHIRIELELNGDTRYLRVTKF